MAGNVAEMPVVHRKSAESRKPDVNQTRDLLLFLIRSAKADSGVFLRKWLHSPKHRHFIRTNETKTHPALPV